MMINEPSVLMIHILPSIFKIYRLLNSKFIKKEDTDHHNG
jgi:hypothetical protein